MSVEAINWALGQQLPPGRSTAKHLLTIIANQGSNDPQDRTQMIAYPSYEYLVWATGQNRKTVIANIKLLQDWGLIEDTGKRVGKTKQVIVFLIKTGPDLFHDQSRYRNPPKSGTVRQTVPISEPSQILPKTVPDFPEAVPISGPGTKSNQEQPRAVGDVRTRTREDQLEELEELSFFDRNLVAPLLSYIPDAVKPQVFADYVKHRQVKRGPFSISELLQIKSLLLCLAADNVDLNKSLELTIALGLVLPVDPRKQAPPRQRQDRPRVNDDFKNATYVGTPRHELPKELRDPEPVD